MNRSTTDASRVFRRISTLQWATVGAIVFLANAGLLVLQLVAGRLLAPFVGSSLETWTGVIGSFLAGIALGNVYGGKLASRVVNPRRLAVVLVCGAIAAFWMVTLPMILNATHWHLLLPIEVRIPVLAVMMCFPVGFILSLLTPLSIQVGLPDQQHVGRVAGMIFSLSTLGCLVGNFATGYVLIPTFTVNAIVYATAGLLLGTAGLSALILTGGQSGDRAARASSDSSMSSNKSIAVFSMPMACLIVFLCSFCGMTLEITASRLLAQMFGVSLFTWTGIIGVMLAGTACGNWLGGMIADRCAQSADATKGRVRLCVCLILASGTIALIIMLNITINQVGEVVQYLHGFGLVNQILIVSLVLFFFPMLLLGTISPQVIRLTVADPARAGEIAGRVYAWSTLGAIVGTFMAGYFLISTIGVLRTILFIALIPAILPILITNVWKQSVMLYSLSMIFGGTLCGIAMFRPSSAGIAMETNYYTIRIIDDPDDKDVQKLQLDLLVHSWVKVSDPTFIYYSHEQIQMELLRVIKEVHPEQQNVLVIGGGGYTFPRCAGTLIPTVKIDVVEIDPGVTRIAYSHLGLDPKLPIRTYNCDGRQIITEQAQPGYYHLVSLDAVNDLSVPYHLLTKECNDAVKRVLTPDGVYLMTVIDVLEYGRIWKSTLLTLRQSFAHVELLASTDEYDLEQQQVYCIYASDTPLDLARLHKVATKQGVKAVFTHRLPQDEVTRLLLKETTILTDQFAPVDNMMAEVFRNRNTNPKADSAE